MTTVKKPAAKAMATAIAAVLCAHLAYAVTPTVVWSGNLGQSYTIDGKTYAFTINPGTGKFNQDGTLTVTNEWTGWPSPYINLSTTGATSVSVLVKFSGLSLPVTSDSGVCIADMADSDDNEVGAYVAKGSSHLSAFYITDNAITQTDLNGSDNAVVESGYMLYSYSTTGGVKAYMGSSMDNLIGGKVESYKFGNGRTISRVSIGGDALGKYYYPAGFKIEAVALFVNEFYTASDVALYEFPAKIYSSDVNVSTINADFSGASEIDVYLDDGVTVTGDTTFTATKVNFHCDGSFNMTPPPSNEATFDFSGVTGRPVLIYSALPTINGSKFTSNVIPTFVTNSTKWRGVIYISSGTFTDFTSNEYGNESSVVRLGNVSGWLRAPGNYAFTNTVPVELAGTLTLNNGNSANDGNPNRCTVFTKLSGGGMIYADGNANKSVVVIQDASEFTGNIGLEGKLIVFGDTMPSYADNNKFENMTASIWVMEGASVTARPASGNWWAIGGIKVAGELRVSGLNKLGGGTYVTTSDTGVFTLITNSNADDMNTDYARIQGTGTLKLEGNAYRCISTNNFPTAMTVDNRLTAGFLHRIPGLEITIGSLAGDGYLRSDWGGTAGDRDLRVLQAKDTTWSGKFWTTNPHRFRSLIVAPGATTSGTLTISATHEAAESTALIIESGAKVNLTGTWVGATTVNGTLSGTGTVDGALTLADGSTLIADTADPLTVSSLSLPSTGTVTISLADSDIGKDFIVSSSSIDTTGKKFAFTVNGEPTNLTVIKTTGGLKAVRPGMKLIFR